ncbi:unnamed protein product, partial [Ectocarpus fasciculatus]
MLMKQLVTAGFFGMVALADRGNSRQNRYPRHIDDISSAHQNELLTSSVHENELFSTSQTDTHVHACTERCVFWRQNRWDQHAPPDCGLKYLGKLVFYQASLTSQQLFMSSERSPTRSRRATL